jgi:cytochrome P450
MSAAAETIGIPSHVPRDRVIDFDLSDLSAYGTDFFGAWKSLQSQGLPDLVWTPHNNGHWIVTRGALIHSLFADLEHFSSYAGSTVKGLGDLTRLIPVQSDPPAHQAYRQATLKGFTAKHIVAIEPEIRRRAAALAEELKPRGACEFITDFAEDLPVSVFLLLIDLPLDDRPRLREIVTLIHRPDGRHSLETLVGMMHDYLRPFVLERLARPGDDMMSRILATPVFGRAWTEDEAMRLASNLLVGGLDTVAALFGFTMQYLAEHPEQRHLLATRREMIPQAVDEFIRRFGPTIPVRQLIRDYELDGVTLKAGDIVALPTMLHNLDERSIPDAMAVRFDRGIVAHSTMGNGPHRCVGAALARLEFIVFLEEWFARIPDFELDPAGTVILQAGGVGTLTRLPLRWGHDAP